MQTKTNKVLQAIFGKNKNGEEGLKNNSFKFLTNATGESTLYIFDEIGWYGIEAQDFANALSQLNGEPLTVRISSNGGSVADGLAIYNMLRDYPGEVTTINDSIAASIASVIYLAGNIRKVAKTASFMTHKPMSSFYGNTDELEAFNAMLQHFNEVIIAAYIQGGVEAEQAKLLVDSGDNWFMSEAAVEMGFATELSDAPAMAAKVDLTKFDNVPETVLNANIKVISPPTETPVEAEINNEEVVTMDTETEGTVTQAEHETAVAEAKTAGYAEALVRRTDVFALESAKGREPVAEKLLANVNLSVEEIDNLLQVTPTAAEAGGLSVENLDDDLGGLGNGQDDSGDDTPVDNVATFRANIGKSI